MTEKVGAGLIPEETEAEQDMPPKRPTDCENILTRKAQDLRMGDHIKS